MHFSEEKDRLLFSYLEEAELLHFSEEKDRLLFSWLVEAKLLDFSEEQVRLLYHYLARFLFHWQRKLGTLIPLSSRGRTSYAMYSIKQTFVIHVLCGPGF